MSNLNSPSEGTCSSPLLPGPCTNGQSFCCQKSQVYCSLPLGSACRLPTVFLPQLHFSCLLHEVFCLKDLVYHLSVTPMQYNTPASSYNSSPAAGELKQSKPPIRKVTLKSLHRGCHSTAGDSRGKGYAIKSSPFGCCPIVQKALGLLCAKCQVSS